MSYDQAQSPRLGQRTPVESTYVQIFDVDPDTPTADLVEAAWPGMLVFRQDLSILQIFDGEAGAWKDVAGGVAGHLTFVGTDPPTGENVKPGDTWVDSDDAYKQYTWTGAEWILAITADMVGPGTFPGPITARFRVGSPIGPNGERVDLDENGLRVFTADPTAVPPGKVGTILGSNGLQVFKGEAEVQNLTTTESATFREAIEYARSSRTKLSAGVSAPGSKPIPDLDWAQTPLTDHDFGLTKPISGMRWVVHTDPVLREASISKWEVPVTGAGVSRMLEFNEDGSFSAQLGADRVYAGAGADIGGVRAAGENYWLSSPGAGDVLLVGPTNSYDFTPLGKGGSKVLGHDGSRLLVVENYLSGATAKARVTKFFPNAAQGSTVVPNGTFDTNITGWSAYSEVAISRTTVAGEYASGTGGLKLTGASPTNAIAVARSSIGTSGFPIVGNRSYQLTAQARNSGPVGNSVTFTLKYYTSAGTFISGQGFNKSSSGGSFQTWTVNTVAPPTAAYGSVEIMVGSLNINSHVYVDNVQVYSQAGLNYDTAFDLTLTGSNDPLRALYVGSADFGEQVYALARAGAGNEVLVVPDDTKVSDPTLTFPQPSTSVRSLGFNGDFWTLDENKVLHRHESGNGFTTQSSRWWASCTYQIPGTAETLMGPAQDFTMSRRARLTLTVPAILETEDTDPTHVGVYLGRDPNPVDRLDMHYQGNTDTGSKVITSADFTAANPPDTPGVFGDATPAELYADTGGFVLYGDSTGDWPALRMRVLEEGIDAGIEVKTLDFRGSGVYVGPGVNPGDAVVTVSGGGGEEGSVQVGAAMYRTTAHSIAHNTTTQMNFGTVVYQNPVGTANTTTDQITVPEDGLYFCEAYVQFDSGEPTNSGLRTIYLITNGTAWRQGRWPTHPTNHATFAYVGALLPLLAGDVVTASLLQTQGNSLATSASTDGHAYWLSTTKVGGIKGDQGPIGLTGPQGEQGIPGIQGPIGPTGPAGTMVVQDENATVVAAATQLDFQGSYVTAAPGAAGEAIITIGPPPASYSSAILADSPLAYWRFGETAGTYADSSGNGRVLTDFGAGGNRGVTGLISGDTDKAFEANNLSFSKHAYRSYETWMTPAALTYEVLCKPTTRASAREHYSLVSRGMDVATPLYLRLSQVSGDTYRAVVGWYSGGVAKGITGATTFNITANPIIHLAFTHDGTTGRLYFNGTEDGNFASGAVQGGGTWLVYGTWNQANYTYPYQGTIDEGAIYGTALSPARIAAHVAGLTVPGPDYYTHSQGTAAATWVINHPLTFRPNVAVVDSTGRQVEGDVVYTDADTITVNFSGAFAGAAYLS